MWHLTFCSGLPVKLILLDNIFDPVGENASMWSKTDTLSCCKDCKAKQEKDCV